MTTGFALSNNTSSGTPPKCSNAARSPSRQAAKSSRRMKRTNVERLSKVEATDKDSRVAILRDDTRLPISRTGYARLSALLGE